MTPIFRHRAPWLLCLGLLLCGLSPSGHALGLTWDAPLKKHTVTPGETNVHFAFQVTNTATDGEIVINAVRPSCGCTTAKVPPLPWHLKPGADGQIEAVVDITGKHGTVSKLLIVESATWTNYLTMVITIPESREMNMELAKADRQTVFKGDCASCHVTPTVGKTGEELYRSACGICHESDHRASMVPNLMALNKATGRDYWDAWIRKGKQGSLMPAFEKSEGGPLDENQIKSLVDFLGGKITAHAGNLPPTGSP